VLLHCLQKYCTCNCLILVPKVRPNDVDVTDIGNNFATITWTWDSLWQEEQGEMTQIQGQLKGFRVCNSVNHASIYSYKFYYIPSSQLS
jgi:hypothetical protein